MLPVFALANQYSGSVKSLSGAGVAGVSISLGSLVTLTDAHGNWVLNGTSQILSGHRAPILVGKNLTVENGHVTLGLQGVDLQGRNLANQAIRAARVNTEAARSAVLPDTILVRWNNKTLFRLPMTKDSSGIALALDTAWSDDRGLAWNPMVVYGSVAQGGTTYRTVLIGSQRWMAENLNDKGTSPITGVCYKNSDDSCAKYGRHYTWAESMSGSKSSSLSPSGVMGICPSGWHVPSDSEWVAMLRLVDTGSYPDITKLMSSSVKGYAQSKNYAEEYGSDVYGFRAFLAGYYDRNFNAFGGNGFWWSATESDSTNAWSMDVTSKGMTAFRSYMRKGVSLSIRCKKD
ncbi:MAG: hypothetical protein RL173_2609 [Fibrobacterota bacterium]|jgi:uncharacterized protein (TIGR02145 family)